MVDFFKKKNINLAQIIYKNIPIGFYQENIDNYIFLDELNEEYLNNLCFIKYRYSLKKYCINTIGTKNERLIICSGDISKIKCDCVINAARPSLLGGGGVDGAIHNAAGPKLYEECQKLNGCEYGEAKITKGYNMYCKNIIHTVGPIYRNGEYNEKQTLENSYKNSFDLAISNNLKTIACPAISCGNYGYPIDEGIEIALNTAIKYLHQYENIKIIFVVNNTIFNKFKEIIM